MPINETRKDFFIRMPRAPVPFNFEHEEAASKPASPVWPDTLTAPQQADVTEWRITGGAAKAVLYAALDATEKAKADEYTAHALAFKAWKMADRLARENQFHWMHIDSAIMNYLTVPRSGSTTGTGSGAPLYPVGIQEP